jgi:hypothetical protein
MTRLALVLLVASAAVAAPVPKSLKAKPPVLEGRWQPVVMNSGGRSILSANEDLWDVRGGTISRLQKQPDGTFRPTSTVTITIPDPTRPDEMDYESGGKNSVFRALIQVTADELTIRFGDLNAPRPADMTEGKDGYLYKRVTEK